MDHKVVVLNTLSLAKAPTEIDFDGDQPEAIDFTPDGKLAVVLTGGRETRLHLVDTSTEHDLASFAIGSDPPAAVVTSPDGENAYAVLSGEEISLVPVDLQHRLPDASVTTGLGPPAEDGLIDIAITPLGDRIYITGGNTQQAVILPVGERSPAEWFVTSDSAARPARVVPLCIPKPSPVQLAVVFGQSVKPYQPNNVATGFSQVVPVAGPCSYELSFFGSATDPDALAEVFWLDVKGTLLQTDTVPIQIQSETISSTAFMKARQAGFQLLLHRARFKSPAGAVQAELRFSAPPFAGVALGLASLQGTVETLNNSDLQLFEGGLPVGWTLSAQYPRGVTVTSVADGIQFINASVGDAELIQSTAVTAKQPYTWELTGRPINSATTRQEPSIELRWLKSDGSVAGIPTRLTLDTGGFVHNPASGITPDGTATVEVHLKAPPGTGIEINQVSLQISETATVPLTFISEAPGELRVSRSQVSYDVVPVPPPPVPSQGLRTPTAPGSKPGDPPRTTYCPRCQDERVITQPQSAMTGAGRPVVAGVCQVCGSGLMRPGGQLSPGARVLRVPLLPPHWRGTVIPAPQQSPMLPPLAGVPGIREDDAVKHAASLIERAKELIATQRRSTVTPSEQRQPQPAPPPEEKE
jgi:hypothetical protein